MLVNCIVVDLSDEDTIECIRTANGSEYIGTVSQTVSGRSCQYWNSQSPHSHFFTEIDMFPDHKKDKSAKLADVKNYCRNAAVSSFSVYTPLPWCYTNSSGNITWEYCNIPRCKGTFMPSRGLTISSFVRLCVPSFVR